MKGWRRKGTKVAEREKEKEEGKITAEIRKETHEGPEISGALSASCCRAKFDLWIGYE